jgi:hypothetical protein
VNRRRTEQLVLCCPLELSGELREPHQDRAHRCDRVDTEIWPRAVRGPTRDLGLEACEALVSDADPLIGRLADDRAFSGERSKQALGSGRRELLVDHAGDHDIAR